MEPSIFDQANVVIAQADALFTAEIPDPLALNRLAWLLGDVLWQVKTQSAAHDAGRKTIHLECRDELIGHTGPDGKPFSRTAAETEARTAPRYLAYVAEGEKLSRLAERLDHLREIARQRAYIATELRRVDAEMDRAEAEEARYQQIFAMLGLGAGPDPKPIPETPAAPAPAEEPETIDIDADASVPAVPPEPELAAVGANVRAEEA